MLSSQSGSAKQTPNPHQPLSLSLSPHTSWSPPHCMAWHDSDGGAQEDMMASVGASTPKPLFPSHPHAEARPGKRRDTHRDHPSPPCTARQGKGREGQVEQGQGPREDGQQAGGPSTHLTSPHRKARGKGKASGLEVWCEGRSHGSEGFSGSWCLLACSLARLVGCGEKSVQRGVAASVATGKGGLGAKGRAGQGRLEGCGWWSQARGVKAVGWVDGWWCDCVRQLVVVAW